MKLLKKLARNFLSAVLLVALLLPFVPATPVLASTETIYVLVGSDDGGGYNLGSSSWSNSGGYAAAVGTWAGNVKGSAYARFLVNIAQAAEVTSAYIHIVTEHSDGGTNSFIAANDIDNANTITSGGDQAGRTRTSARVAWNLGGLNNFAYNQSPDIKTVIQEVLDRGGWSSGNYIILFIEDQDQTSGSWTNVRSIEGGAAYKMKLVINYTVPIIPEVTTNAVTDVEETTVTLNADVTAINDADITERGFVWDLATQGAPGDVVPASSGYANYWTESGTFGTGTYTHGLTGLTKGELYFIRAAVENDNPNWGYGDEVKVLTKPDAPNTFVANGGDEQVGLTWNIGSGSSQTYIRGKLGSYPTNRTDGYEVYFSTGTSTTDTGLTNGNTYYYRAWGYATEATEEEYSDLYVEASATANIPGAPPVIASVSVEGFGRDWVILKGQVTDDQSSTVNLIGFEYGLTDSYGFSKTASGSWDDTDNPYFLLTITDLSPGSVYHWRAKGSYSGSDTGYGSDLYFTTTGSAVIYEYYNTGGDGDSTAVYTVNWLAEQFTADDVSHSTTAIRLNLKRVGNPGTITVSLKHANDSDLPTGLDLASATLDGDTFSTSYGWYEFTVDETSLEGGEKYALVVRAVAGDASNYVMWQKDTGGGLADAVASYSADGGVSWTTASPIDYLFEIWGNPSIEIKSAAVFEDYLATGDMLFVIEYINTYPPYFPVSDPARYFDIRLYETDGTTIIASTVLKRWGNKPISIYLNPNQAVPLTPGSQFYVKLRGSFTGNPTASYQLATDDWRGTDLTYLDKWVILTAGSMESYYDENFIIFITDKGDVLNEEGGILFADGINGLANVRPDLFQTTVNLPEYELPTWTNAFAGAENWENMVGADVVSIVDDVGDVFGVKGQDIAAMGILLLYGMFSFFLLRAGHVMPTLVLALPIVLFGAWLRVIDIVIVGLVMSILALYFVWHFWWSRT